jgi:hypothetical protein
LSDWKLIYYHHGGTYEAFNLAEDLGEEHNRAEDQPKLAAQLADRLRRYLVAVDAQMPRNSTTGPPVPLPGERPQPQ